MSTQSPIIITGAARSGTSLISGVINICGAFGGVTAGPTINNQKGMFENGLIKKSLNKEYLAGIGADPRGQYPLPDVSKMYIPVDWKDKVHSILKTQGYDKGPWYYKSATNSHIWPIWNYAFPNAKWIIVRRKSSDIAESCLKTGFMNAYSNYEDWIKWVNWHEDRFVEMVQAGVNVKQIWPERLMKGNYEQLYEVIEWLGLEWKPTEVMEFIEPKLWKSKIKEQIIKK